MITLLGTLFGMIFNYEDMDDFEMGRCYDTPESRTLVSCVGCILIVETIWTTIKCIYRFIRKK